MPKREKPPPPQVAEPWAVVVEWTTDLPDIVGPFRGEGAARAWVEGWKTPPPEVLRIKAVSVGALLDALAPLWNDEPRKGG